MQGKVKLLFLTLFFVLAMSCNVMGYTGKGTSDNPYLVSNEMDLSDVLINKGKATSWVYVGIDAKITLSKNIAVGAGKFRIFANEKDRIIKRSNVLSASINDSSNPKYCMKLYNNTQLEFGYPLTTFKLTLDGSAEAFSAKNPCQGWFNIGADATLVIDQHCVLRNTLNNKESASNASINLKGTLIVNGEISKCNGINGGAANISETGVMTVNSLGRIHHCNATTEGGAVYCEDQGQFTLNGGQINNCSAKEEGGAIFLTGDSYARLLSGLIFRNSAGKTGGGVFAGMGAVLEVGKEDGSGPNLYYNSAGTSGGGIRCNGGVSKNAGGTTYFYGGKIHENSAEHYGGGISCGSYGGVLPSRLLLTNLKIYENTCGMNGAGIWIGTGIKGIGRDDILIKKCLIYQNNAQKRAGGIKVSSDMMSSENKIWGNDAGEEAGGLYIAPNITYKADSGTIYNNTCATYGAGVYLEGYFKISAQATVSVSNRIYLCSGTFIDVIGKLTYSDGKIAFIESEEKEIGTKLVRVNYDNKTGSAELYYGASGKDEYTNEEIPKKFLAYDLQEKQCLRPTEEVMGYAKNWIIISEKYLIEYEKNLKEDVSGMPDAQRKFWHEPVHISNQPVTAEGYIVNEKTHWNTKKDGNGDIFTPGALYDADNDFKLFAQWIRNLPKELFITADDRYFVVGQNISLTKKELLKKVIVEDDLKTGTNYQLAIVEISLPGGAAIAANSDIAPETKINTDSKGEYVLTIKAFNESGSLSKKKTMHVHILEEALKNNQVRFISYQYFGTINKKSKWNRHLRSELSESLLKEESSYIICLSGSQIKQIKKEVKENNYIVDGKMNKKIVNEFRKTNT